MSKCYGFICETAGIGKGYVTADSMEEAEEKIKNGDYDDLEDVELSCIGEIVEMWRVD